MTRPQQRAVAIACMVAFGLFFIWLGEDGWEINAIPAQYAGYLVIAVGIAAALGLDIWRGGPLDPSQDHVADKPAPSIPKAKSR